MWACTQADQLWFQLAVQRDPRRLSSPVLPVEHFLFRNLLDGASFNLTVETLVYTLLPCLSCFVLCSGQLLWKRSHTNGSVHCRFPLLIRRPTVPLRQPR